jgi:hypothetical protein
MVQAAEMKEQKLQQWSTQVQGTEPEAMEIDPEEAHMCCPLIANNIWKEYTLWVGLGGFKAVKDSTDKEKERGADKRKY